MQPSQKAPSAIRCIKTRSAAAMVAWVASSQKAPSAIRCIKTRERVCGNHVVSRVRKHRAP